MEWLIELKIKRLHMILRVCYLRLMRHNKHNVCVFDKTSCVRVDLEMFCPEIIGLLASGDSGMAVKCDGRLTELRLVKFLQELADICGRFRNA